MLLLTLLLAAQDPTPPAVKPVPDPDRVTCKNQLKTGSRVNFVQVCHTAAEWELLRSENRKVVERAQNERGWYEKDKP